MSSDKNDMGNLFQQRRAAAAARKEDAGASVPVGETVTNNKPKKNLLEIQAEQAQAQERTQNSPSRPNSNSDSNTSRNSSRGGESNQSVNSSRGGVRRGRGGGSGPSRSNLPIEQGIICSLKESFGFIHCADRPEELFFHYSEVSGCHPDKLQIDTEVEFRIGAASNSRNSSSDEKKMAAFQVEPLAPGTIVWETEMELGKRFQGLVERQVRNDQRGGRDSINNNSNNEGTIRILEPQDAETKDGQELKATGSLARFLATSYAPPESKSMDIRSAHVPNRLFRDDLVEFILVTDRRTKELNARCITLVQSEKDRSRIEKEKKLMEQAVPEEGVVISLKSDFGFLKSNKRREHIYFRYSHLVIPETEEEFVLKQGQEMKFLVVVENDNQNQKSSARQLECLPKGSVIFHRVIAEGRTGIVTRCPRPPSNSTATDEKDGTVRLVEPISDKDTNGEEKTIQDVSLHFGDCPGGVFPYQQRGGAVAKLWIQEGDTLLFDLVKEIADGSYRAAPTQYTAGKDIPTQPIEDASKDATAAVRLVDLSMVGRAEGVVHTLKEAGGFGFIHFADRPVDVHFKFHDLLPVELQSDLRKRFEGDEKSLKLQVGSAVQFDLSALGKVSSNNGRGRQGRGGQHERENLSAQRIALLPSSAVSLEKVVATGVKGVVKSEDVKQLYAGIVELENEFESMSLEERHPLVAKMIDSFLGESSSPSGSKSLVFRDILSMKEDDVVVEMVKAKGEDILSCTHIPVAGLSSHPGRLCIRRLDDEVEQEQDDKNVPPSKIKNSKAITKTFRFEKPNLAEELKDDVPPGSGDVITCDIVQMRRTGKVVVQNLRVLERKEREPGVDPVSTSTTGVGIVKEVVPNRNFGFISVLDENATKRDLIFFHISDLISDQGNEEGLKSKKPESVRKGDEVKFQVGVEKNGKRVALNVQVVPKGTIPAKAALNACRGFILMEPSLVSLSDAPLRKSHSTTSQGSDKVGSGRWNNVKEEHPKTQQSDIVEEGCILLLEDKAGMFSTKSASTKMDTPALYEGDAMEKVSEEDSDEDTAMGANNVGVVCTHLPYKNGAIAIHGAGSSSAVDNSSNPRRGDLVTFVKAKSGKGVRDIRVLTRQAATLLHGRLEDIVRADASDGGYSGTAKFIAATEKEEEYDVGLEEVVSCDVAILKEKQAVEGVLHEGRIFGICRTMDLYLESKLGANHKERRKLNLSVKKGLGGKIIAQSMMGKVCTYYRIVQCGMQRLGLTCSPAFDVSAGTGWNTWIRSWVDHSDEQIFRRDKSS
jgi:cold shock CspA family protein